MQIVVDMYDLGFRLIEISKQDLELQLKKYPSYLNRVYDFYNGGDCSNCPLDRLCNYSITFNEDWPCDIHPFEHLRVYNHGI